MKQRFLKIKNLKFLAYLFGLAGFFLYTSKTIFYAFYLNSIIDEGLFLLKGIYFTNGTYAPYQDYGFWMNKMPFGYLFSGWLQKLFGAGLQTGRVAAVFFGLLSLLGMWLLIPRLTRNPWLAGLAVWIFALNNSLIQIYSQWFSEVLVACLMTWVLFFVLGKPRQTWHYLSGGFLLGIIIITRQNLVPMMLLLPLYVYWETKQWKPVLFVFFPTLFLFFLIHVLYWPNILQMWLPWLPQSLTPFLDRFRIELPGTPFYNPYIPFQTRLHAFWEAIRIHFIPIFLSLTALILFYGKKDIQIRNKKSPQLQVIPVFTADLSLFADRTFFCHHLTRLLRLLFHHVFFLLYYFWHFIPHCHLPPDLLEHQTQRYQRVDNCTARIKFAGRHFLWLLAQTGRIYLAYSSTAIHPVGHG